MDQNTPSISIPNKIRNILRVIFFMLRKGISKKKLILDLNMLLKRGNKIASKAINNLLHHHHNSHRDTAPPREYEFSCSNTPNYTLPFNLNKRRRCHNTHFFSRAFNAQRTHDCADGLNTLSVDYNAVKMALEMLATNNTDVAAVSPMVLPGFGKSPAVRQLRITDSPFPLKNEDDGGVVDSQAEEFIQKFYRDLRLQKRNQFN